MKLVGPNVTTQSKDEPDQLSNPSLHLTLPFLS